MNVTLHDIANRFIGMSEVKGSASNPGILAMLKLDGDWPEDDAVPWCSAALNYWAWLLRLPRSKSLRARSWLAVGRAIADAEARVGFDVVILKQHIDDPDAHSLDARGHVGLYSGGFAQTIHVLGGNQGDRVSVAPFPFERVLGIRRLSEG